jgi:hypothetical protein
MGKKKLSIAQTSKAAAKAAKKAKAAQKIERKEKKKLGKVKDEFEDDQDLEAILENVSEHSAFTFLHTISVVLTKNFFFGVVDPPRMGGGARCYGRACGRTTEPQGQRDSDGMSQRRLSVVYWRRVLRRRWEGCVSSFL